jgi:hypothetical protein
MREVLILKPGIGQVLVRLILALLPEEKEG